MGNIYEDNHIAITKVLKNAAFVKLTYPKLNM